MRALKVYSFKNIEKLISTRKGETKFGEKLQFISELDMLKDQKAKYVLFGIPEDIGVRANHGKAGTSGAWMAALKSLVNIQQNRFNKPESLLLLGELNCDEWMEKASNLGEEDPNYHVKLGDLVKEIDEQVSAIVEKIVAAGKIPIILGGGHNNAFGNIKGSAKALKNPVNVINIDAHTDLRQLEHRHSGNGFSYAIKGEYLKNYHVFGLQKNYTPEYIFQEMEQSETLTYTLAEDLFSEDVTERFSEELDKIAQADFGLELDCDAISGFPSSAVSPSGFSVNAVRRFISMAGKKENCRYFHICEASPTENDAQTGKALAYFISDFIR
ncbi:MAG: formimidoylglutamase [Christiangramia sp.]|uniref:formimidoylglutamase n=1 Tax=Christiangramia sp. TaxID=1931228 RepID=UPI003241C6A1